VKTTFFCMVASVIDPAISVDAVQDGAGSDGRLAAVGSFEGLAGSAGIEGAESTATGGWYWAGG